MSKLPKMVRSELGQPALEEAARVGDAQRAPNKSDKQAEDLRSMFVAMAEDWRIVVIKLADRLHNMRTLQCATAVCTHRAPAPPRCGAAAHLRSSCNGGCGTRR